MASELEIRYFSIEEANRAIKELRKILKRDEDYYDQ